MDRFDVFRLIFVQRPILGAQTATPIRARYALPYPPASPLLYEIGGFSVPATLI